MSDAKLAKNQLEKIFKALANRRRLAIIAYLEKISEANVGHIAWEIKLSVRATSRHLVILERAGLLQKQQRGKEVFYKITIHPKSFIREIFEELRH